MPTNEHDSAARTTALDGPRESGRSLSESDPSGTSLSESDRTTLTDGPTVGALKSESPVRFGRGDAIGRYVVLEPLGAGGMGVVYAAYDPQLDRRVAIKLIHPRLGEHLPRMRARLLREAQALAKLDDAHVLRVYDVGTVGARIFLATEFVSGRDLQAWLAEKARDQAEILQVFSEAGQGLAAAHAAGMVHRDFKLSNVMVRDDGRAVVLDFGLARPARVVDDGDDSEARDAARDAVIVPFDQVEQAGRSSADAGLAELTEAGAVIGTPAYMAPEQWDGQQVTAAADQFSFCVALYRALYGTLPFSRRPGERPTFEIEVPGDGSKVPAWLRRLLIRGLAAAPDERHPSMASLLRELRADPVKKRRRRFALAGLLMAGLLLALLWPRPEEVCAGSLERFETVWNRQSAAEVINSLGGVERPYAGALAEATLSSLDELGQRWVLAHREACEATHVRHEQSASLLDQRMACLDGVRREVGALVRLFVQEPATSLDGALRAVSSLSSLEACADVESLVARTPPPSDAESQRRLGEVRVGLSEARALNAAGRYHRGLEAVAPVLEGARATLYPPLLAEALVLSGSLKAASGDPEGAARDLEEGVFWGGAGRDDRASAEAFVRLVRVAGYQQGDLETGRRFAALASAVVDRLGQGSELAAALADHQATLDLQAGDLEAAAENERRAIRLKEEIFGANHPAVARSLVRLGNVEEQAGRRQEARDLFAQALEIFESHLGPDHPEVAMNIDRLGAAELALGRYEIALEHHRKALSVLRAGLGDHPLTAAALTHLGNALADAGQPEAAAERQAEALEVYGRTLGVEHAHAALARSNLALALADAERFEEARRHFELTLETQERLHGPDHPWVATTRFNLAELLAEIGDFSAALPGYERALAVWRSTYGAEHPLIDRGEIGLGRALVGMGRPAEALAHLEPALVRAEAREPKEWVALAHGYFASAQALWRQGRSSESSLAARRASAAVERVRSESALARRLQGWLDSRPENFAEAESEGLAESRPGTDPEYPDSE